MTLDSVSTAERRWQDVKRITNTLLDRTNSPENTWLLALQYVCFVLNHMATPSLKHRVPLQVLTGSTVDISAILRFVWYEPVYFRNIEPAFPSDSREDHGFFVGFAHNVIKYPKGGWGKTTQLVLLIPWYWACML